MAKKKETTKKKAPIKPKQTHYKVLMFVDLRVNGNFLVKDGAYNLPIFRAKFLQRKGYAKIVE